MKEKCVFFFVLIGLPFMDSFEQKWDILEDSFIDSYREEWIITKVSTDSSFKVNETVRKWISFSLELQSYAAGISEEDSKKLIVVISKLSSNNSTQFVNRVITFDLGESAVTDLQWFNLDGSKKKQLFLIVYFPRTREISWFKLKNSETLEKVWKIQLDHEAAHVNIFRVFNKNYVFVVNTFIETNRSPTGIFYEVDKNLKHYWFSHSINITSAVHSSAVSNFEENVFFSLTQNSKDTLEIYSYEEGRFNPHSKIISFNITQVVSFENGFKSFLAINGLDAGIYEITQHGLENSEVSNSNLEELDFWLPIHIQTYRDETILLAQRILNHGTHKSFDFDIFTYNGHHFEEHEDIPCIFFGEEEYSLKCFGEYGSNIGLTGATYISLEDTLGLIIPHTHGISVLFTIQTTLRPLPNPFETEIEEILAKKELLEKLLNDNQNIINQKITQNSAEHSSRSSSKSSDALKYLANMEKLSRQASQLAQDVNDFQTHSVKIINESRVYNTIFFNEPVEITAVLDSEALSVDELNEEDISNLLQDIVAVDSFKEISGSKTFVNIEVENVNFENVNGISKNDFVIKNSGELSIDGHVTFTNEVISQYIESHLVNDITVQNEWIDIALNIEDPLNFDHIEVRSNFTARFMNNKSLEIEDHTAPLMKLYEEKAFEKPHFPVNLTVENINGVELNAFLSKLCLNTLKCFIPNLKVLGNITVSGSASTDSLNNVKYPEDYVSSESSDNEEALVEILGSKIFLNIVRGYEVESNSTINDIHPGNYIDKNSPQTIGGQVAFADLEVNSVLKVNGDIKGQTAEQFLSNLDLNETDILMANVEFNNLEVVGNIFVQNQYGNLNLNEILEDVILKDDQLANINGTKQFLSTFTVLKNLNIGSSAIANVSLKDIIAKDTNEDLNIRSVHANIDIENLMLKGVFDDRNITKLNNTLLKIHENVTISSMLIFESPLQSNSLKIHEKLNEISPDGYLYTSPEKNNLAKTILLHNATVENLIVEGNFDGNISNFNVTEFVENTLKYTGDQIIDDAYSFNKSVLHELRVLNLNNLLYNDLFSCTNFSKKLIRLITSGEAKVNHLALNGSVNLGKLENQDLGSSLKDKLLMKLRAHGDEQLFIEGDVYFDQIEIQELASVNFDDFVNSVVFKDVNNITIKDTINFKEVVSVKKLLQTQKVNDIFVQNILRNDGDQIVESDITIYGNVSFSENTVIANDINDVSTDYLAKNFKVDEHMISVNGEAIFEKLANIENLKIEGLINEQDLESLKSKFVYLDQEITLVENTIFRNKVNVMNHMEVSNSSNEIKLNDLKNIVWKSKNTTISGPVRFAESVELFNALNVEEKLNTRYLFNEVLEDKLEDTVHIDRGFLPGKYVFKDISIADNLNTQFLNSLNMSAIVPLKSDQIIDYLDIREFTTVNNIKVGGLVNDLNLLEEVNNSKLVDITQKINSELIFLNNNLVEQNLRTETINSHDSEKIVYLHHPQNLTGIYEFSSNVWINENVMVHGLINNIDVRRLNSTSLKSLSKDCQVIHEDMDITDSITFADSVSNSGYIDSINITNLAKRIEEKRKYRLLVESGIRKDYSNLCTDITYMFKNVRNQIYKFKYFENLQKLSFPSSVHTTKYFTANNRHFMLVNEKSCCFSHLLEWEGNEFHHSEKFHTGQIDQVAVTYQGDNIYLVTRHSHGHGNCDIANSTLIWLMRKHKKLEVVGSIENQDLLQESMVRATFYGLKNNVVTKFKITLENEQIAIPVTKWKVKGFKGELFEHPIDTSFVKLLCKNLSGSLTIFSENLSFMPRNLQTGLCLRTGKELIFLDNKLEENENLIFDSDTEEFVIGNYTVQSNFYVPARKDGEIAVAVVGTKSSKKNLMVVLSHKDTQVQHRLDLIEIYTDAFSGKLFDQIRTFKPSSPLAVEFGNGETLLVFLEDNKFLQVYEYKGIEGFKHRSTIRMNGSFMFLMELPIPPHLNPRKVVGVVRESKIILIEAVMAGNRVDDNLTCDIP